MQSKSVFVYHFVPITQQSPQKQKYSCWLHESFGVSRAVSSSTEVYKIMFLVFYIQSTSNLDHCSLNNSFSQFSEGKRGLFKPLTIAFGFLHIITFYSAIIVVQVKKKCNRIPRPLVWTGWLEGGRQSQARNIYRWTERSQPLGSGHC